MKLYYNEADVGGYTIQAVGSSAKKCIDAIVKEYNKHFGSFRENGFKNRADWIEYHELDEESCQEIELDKAWVR